MKEESLSRKLTLGVFYLFTGSTVSVLLTVITLSYLSRKLGVENFGLYSAILSFVGLFQFLSNLGVNRTLLKYGSTELDKAGESFGNALFLKLILILPLVCLIWLSGYFAGYTSEELKILIFFALSIIFESFGSIFISIRRILGHFKLISFFKAFRTLLNLIVIFVALKIENSVYFLSIAIFAFSFTAFLIALINTILLLKPKLNLKILPEVIKDSFIFSLNDFFSKFYIRGSIVMISMFTELHTVGIFSAAIRFTKIASLFPKQVRVAVLPTMYRILDENKSTQKEESSSLIESDKNRSKRVFKTMLKYMSLLSAPLAISIYFFSEYFIQLIFGSKYNGSIYLVQILSIFIFLRFIQTPFNLYYLGLNKHNVMVAMQGISTITLIVFGFILIPSNHTTGACLAVNISEFIYFLVLIIYGTRFGIWSIGDILNKLISPLATCLISLLAVTYTLSSSSIFIQLPIILALYIIFLLISRQINKKDFQLFEKIALIKFKKN